MNPMNFQIEVRTVAELRRLADFLMDVSYPEAVLSVSSRNGAGDVCLCDGVLVVTNVQNDLYRIHIKVK